MIKIKSALFLLIIFLLFNCLCFSQAKNSYMDFISDNSDKYKAFQKNFNPRKYDPAILKGCFIEMVNDLRQHLYGGAPLVNLQMLDSVAQMQAEFQALKDKLSVTNEPPFQYTSQRLKKYGFTVQGTEIVSKAKAHQGDKDYSYYDLCLELLKPLLKPALGTPAFLSPEYTFFGFASDADKYMRSVYISLVLGNDLTNQVFNSVGSKQKDLPITRGLAGLRFYDETICKKIAEDHTLEQIYDMLYWNEDGEVFLQSDDARAVKKLLSKAGNAIVLDFIQKEQYNCRVPQVDNNKPFRGIVSKPISIEKKILAANDSTAKSNIFHAKIGSIPPQIELTKPIDINILLLNGKKHVCRTLIKRNLHNLKTNDAVADSLIQALNYEGALYRLAPMLSDSTLNENQLFSIVQLAAHKPKTILSSIFTKSVQMAALRNPQRLCKLLDEFSVAVFDNAEVRKVYCGACK
jgi:hypothetical protein